jgi:hypothetical protein
LQSDLVVCKHFGSSLECQPHPFRQQETTSLSEAATIGIEIKKATRLKIKKILFIHTPIDVTKDILTFGQSRFDRKLAPARIPHADARI